MKKWLLAALLFCFTQLQAEADPFFIATHPKGGTGLLAKTLFLIAGEKPTHLFCHFDGHNYSPHMLDEFLEAGSLPILHLYAPQFTYHYLNNYHLYAKPILIIRDPRDAFVSFAYWAFSDYDLSIEDKISLVFQTEGYCDMTAHLSTFLSHPRCYIVRFEELIGPKGGGDLSIQIETIRNLAAHINIHLLESEVVAYADQLFGNQEDTPHSATFRSGQIGSWKTHFTKEHIALFKERYGDELIRLGYESNGNW